jgi:hypothetical protein
MVRRNPPSKSAPVSLKVLRSDANSFARGAALALGLVIGPLSDCDPTSAVARCARPSPSQPRPRKPEPLVFVYRTNVRAIGRAVPDLPIPELVERRRRSIAMIPASAGVEPRRGARAPSEQLCSSSRHYGKSRSFGGVSIPSLRGRATWPRPPSSSGGVRRSCGCMARLHWPPSDRIVFGLTFNSRATSIARSSSSAYGSSLTASSRALRRRTGDRRLAFSAARSGPPFLAARSRSRRYRSFDRKRRPISLRSEERRRIRGEISVGSDRYQAQVWNHLFPTTPLPEAQRVFWRPRDKAAFDQPNQGGLRAIWPFGLTRQPVVQRDESTAATRAKSI